MHDVEAPADWEAVYRDHVTDVYRFVYARVGNRPDAEDVTSTAFLRALPHLRRGSPAGDMRAYLMATARTALADLWRERYAAPASPLLDDDVPEAEAQARDIDVEPVLGGLPPHYRQVLELRFLRGYSIRETAEAMHISVSNAKVMQLRALRQAARVAEPPA